VSEAVPRQELETAIAARRELGPEYEDEILDTFLAKVDQRLARGGPTYEESERALKRRRDHQKEMILGAMGISVPLFIVAALVAGLAGMIVVCATLAVIALVAGRTT
jgi:hypothetical protein